DWHVPLFGLLIDKNGVTLRKCSASAVLTRHSDMRALGAQRGDRQCLGGRPVDPFSGLDGGTFRFQLASYLRVEAKAFRHRDETAPDPAQPLARNPGVAGPVVVRRFAEAGPGAFEPIRLIWAIALGRLELHFELSNETGCHRVGIALAQHTCFDEALGVE